MPTIQQIKYRTILNSHVRFTTEFIVQLASGEVGIGAAPQAKRRVAGTLPPALRKHPAKGLRNDHVDINFESIRACRQHALWLLLSVRDQISEWFDFGRLETDIKVVTHLSDVKSK